MGEKILEDIIKIEKSLDERLSRKKAEIDREVNSIIDALEEEGKGKEKELKKAYEKLLWGEIKGCEQEAEKVVKDAATMAERLENFDEEHIRQIVKRIILRILPHL